MFVKQHVVILLLLRHVESILIYIAYMVHINGYGPLLVLGMGPLSSGTQTQGPGPGDPGQGTPLAVGVERQRLGLQMYVDHLSSLHQSTQGCATIVRLDLIWFVGDVDGQILLDTTPSPS